MFLRFNEKSTFNNFEILSYIFDLTDVQLLKEIENKVIHISCRLYQRLVEFIVAKIKKIYSIVNRDKLNILLRCGRRSTSTYDQMEMINVIDTINPFLLDPDNLITYPFESEYDEFTKYVDEFKINIPIIWQNQN